VTEWEVSARRERIAHCAIVIGDNEDRPRQSHGDTPHMNSNAAGPYLRPCK